MSDARDFFVAGGALHPRTPSYVTRPADAELLQHVLAGEFCYILTPRQMGKSSLMVRTARRLREKGISTAIVDLTSIGTGSVDQWYLGVLTRITSGLGLRVDVSAWWERQSVSAPQRFMAFLHDFALTVVTEPIVIFVDEIDSTLRLDFRDDFFAVIRAMYNARASDPAYKRLTFVLLGVATPTDLIQDRDRTPFNIGQKIVLDGFSYQDAHSLQEGLETCHAGYGETILRRILYWTNGHPYLTQRLCLSAAEDPSDRWDEQRVDRLVESVYFNYEGRKDTNLTFIDDYIQDSSTSERRRMLKLYKRVRRGESVDDDDRSLIQNRLELSGLVQVGQGELCVRNRIYHHIFGLDWIKSNTPVNRQWVIAISSVVLALLVSIGAFALITYQQRRVGTQAYVELFENASTNEERIEGLAGLFDYRPSQGQKALELFYGLTPEEQVDLFSLASPETMRRQLRSVVEGIYKTLDWMPDGRDLKIMAAMVDQLEISGMGANRQLIDTIKHWKDGREWARKGQYDQAITSYDQALSQVPDHPVIHYDRAMAYVELGQYDEALADLAQIIRIARMATPTPTPQSSPSPTVTPTPSPVATSTPGESPTPAAGGPVTDTVQAEPAVDRTSTVTGTSASTTLTPSTTDVPRSIRRFVNADRLLDTVRNVVSHHALLYHRWWENQASYGDLPLTPVPVSTPSDAQVRAADNMVMVYVPPGEFTMGDSAWGRHIVELDGFWIDQTEVTNAQYRRCVEDGACSPPLSARSQTHDAYYGNGDYDDYPVIFVNWSRANAYCTWAGARLPTEAEWEYAARGPEGRTYPWGNAFSGARLNYQDNGCGGECADSQFDDGYADTSPVGTFFTGASWCGAWDMSGNVWEWTADWFGAYPSEREVNPTGPSSGENKVLRGGSWLNGQDILANTTRIQGHPEDYWDHVVGFRCAQDTVISTRDAPMIEYFAASPSVQTPGGEVELSWKVTGETDRIELNQESGKFSGLEPEGQLTVVVGETTVFILTAHRGDLSSSAQIVVTVIEPTATPGPVGAGVIQSFEQWATWTRGDQPYGELSQSTEQVKSGTYAAKLKYDYSSASSSDDFVIFTSRTSIGGQPDTISAWVYGDQSGHFFNVWIEDAEGQVWSVHLGSVTFSGWKRLSGAIDSNSFWPSGKVYGPDNNQIDYPIQFFGIVLDRTSGPRTGAIYIDDIAVSTSTAPATATPALPSVGEIGRIIYTVQIGENYQLWSTDPTWAKGVKIGDTDLHHSTCPEENTSAVALDGTTVGIHPIERCQIAGTVGSCPSPDGLWKVNTASIGDAFSLILWDVSANKQATEYYQGKLNIYVGLNWARDSSHFLFTVDSSVYRADVNKDGFYQVIPFKDNEWPLQYTPDGTYVYYLKPVSGAIADIFVASPDGSGERNLTNAVITVKLCPRWKQ